MDGFQYNLMVDRLKAKGRTDYTDGDIVAEYAAYQSELNVDDPGDTPTINEVELKETLPAIPTIPAV